MRVECGHLLEAGRGKEKDSLLASPGRITTVTLIFAQGDASWTSDL